MKRSVLASTAALTLLSVVLVQACSGEDGDDNEMTQGGLMGQGGAVGGSGAVALGGSAPVGVSGAAGVGVGGTGTEAQGGATNVAGQGGQATSPAAQGGSGGAPPAQGGSGGAPPAQGGSGGAPPTGNPPACIEPPSPSNGISCTLTCTDLCGVFALGSRVCSCPGEEPCDADQTAPCYDCASCGYSILHPLLEPPTAPFPTCPADDNVMENDETGCTENDRCQSIRANDGPRRFCGCLGNEWDCDSKPSNFAF